ncbi:lysylphosphatidylglycerol synthase transmembrane domain-containing protein [Neorhizobium sp. NPDC001467]|uniref:lysylphosphatidylglycerol synthase transmembrane domain-containing protein n=1 Tax=Neorhizobium sp. NPDC001467 TaxID=3390595 RepID=UPI003CFFB431
MNAKRILAWSTMVIGFGLAGYLLYVGLRQYTFSDIVESVRAIPPGNLALGLFFAAASYLCLTFFDWAGVLYVGGRLAYPKIALASFLALSIGQSVGLAGLSSGAIRYRYYAHWGLDAEAVAKIVLMSGVTVGLGLAALGGAVMILNPADTAAVLKIRGTVVTLTGLGLLLACLAYVVLALTLRTPLKIWKWHFGMPTWRVAVMQIVVGTINFALVSACLREVMAASADVSYLKAATAFVLANVAILITHAPGGLGVLEVTVRHVMGDQASIGALVAFRVIYFLIPLAIGLPLSLVTEAVFRARKSHHAPASSSGSAA